MEFGKIKQTFETIVIGAVKSSGMLKLQLSEDRLLELSKHMLHTHCVVLDEVHGFKEKEVQKIMDLFDRNEKIARELIQHTRLHFRDGKEGLN